MARNCLSLLLCLLASYHPAVVVDASSSRGHRFPWRVVRGGSTTTSNTLPAEEMDLNQQAHAKEIEDNTKNGDYFHGPCDALQSDILETKGYSVVNDYFLPDFDDEFRKSQGNDWIQVTSKPLLTKEECNDIISLAETYFQQKKGWSTLPSGRFEIAGSWIKDIPPVRDYFNELLKTKLFPAMAHLFPDVVGDASNLCIQSAYMFKYTPESGEKTDMHIDSSLLSFTILLNDPKDFKGGGTFFECLGDANGEIVEMNQGDVTFRPAGVRHRGQPITNGTRYVIGGFCTLRNKCEHTRQLLNRGTVALTNGDTTTAHRLFCLAHGEGKFSEIHMSIAHTIRKFGDAAGALASYQTAYDANPRSADAAFMVGVMHGEMANDEAAMVWYKKAAALNEYDGDAYYRQGLILGRRLSADDSAEKAMYERAIHMQPNHADAHCNLGVIYGEEGNVAEELACYERALAIEHGNVEAINNAKAAYYHLGIERYQAGDLDGAIHAFGRLVDDLAPDEPMILQMYEAMLKRKEDGSA